MRKKRVLIIGAGPAGLSTAYKLLKDHPDEYKVVIAEKSNVIGGISQTINHNGNRIDIGGHRFFTKNKEIMDLWSEILPIQGQPSKDYKTLNTEVNCQEDGPDPDKDDNVFLVRNRVSRIYYLKKFFDYPITLNLKTIMNLGFIRTFKAGFGYLSSIIHKKNENNLENFMINRFGTPLYHMFFEDYTEKLWGRHPKEINASWGAQRIKGLSLKKAILSALNITKEKETSLIESFYYPKLGPGQFYEKMADKIREMGGEILFNTEVTSLAFESDKKKHITKVEFNHDKKPKKYDMVVSSMPLNELFDALNTKKSPVDDHIYEITAGLPYRDFITVGILVDKLAIKNETQIKTLNGRIPDNWIYVQEKDAKIGRIQIFNNWSPYMVKDNENTVWLGIEFFCNEGDELYNSYQESPDNIVRRAIYELIQMGILDPMTCIKDDIVKYVPKAYPAYFDTYSDINEIYEYIDEFDNLYCIGRNGQHRYNNMDHSMLTGIEAARLITGEKTDKHEIWSINTEQDYHEGN